MMDNKKKKILAISGIILLIILYIYNKLSKTSKNIYSPVPSPILGPSQSPIQTKIITIPISGPVFGPSSTTTPSSGPSPATIPPPLSPLYAPVDSPSPATIPEVYSNEQVTLYAPVDSPSPATIPEVYSNEQVPQSGLVTSNVTPIVSKNDYRNLGDFNYSPTPSESIPQFDNILNNIFDDKFVNDKFEPVTKFLKDNFNKYLRPSY